jgi:pimeloyl-ACP methyl ester carboxylesterase
VTDRLTEGVAVAGSPAGGRGIVAPSAPAGLAATTAGDGPAIVLVHGVGVGPAVFAPLAELLAAAGYRAVVVHRPGYGDAAGQAPLSLPDQVDLLADLLDGLSSPRTPGAAGVVGVSGGATLALLLASRVAGSGLTPVPVVAHEPLLGPLAAALHHRVRRAVSALGAPGQPVRPVATTGFVRRLVGEASWGRLPAAERASVADRPDLVAAEARAFAELAPTGSELARLRPTSPLVTTVGALSGPERRSAATVLSSLTRARVETVPGAGHLAHVDAPEAFAAVALAALGAGHRLGAAS